MILKHSPEASSDTQADSPHFEESLDKFSQFLNQVVHIRRFQSSINSNHLKAVTELKHEWRWNGKTI